eukprot:scaffold34670_cov31-Tisochrysis_lutea.AAC.1
MRHPLLLEFERPLEGDNAKGKPKNRTRYMRATQGSRGEGATRGSLFFFTHLPSIPTPKTKERRGGGGEGAKRRESRAVNMLA